MGDPKTGGSSHVKAEGKPEEAAAPVYPTEFTWPYEGERVFLACSLSRWTDYIPMERKSGGIEYDERRKQWVPSPPTRDPFYHTMYMPAGRHQFKFIVDGRWCYDVMLPTTRDPQGNINNYVDVPPPAAVTSPGPAQATAAGTGAPTHGKVAPPPLPPALP